MKVKTVWEVWGYDVWGNAEEGYWVNDRHCIYREYEMNLTINTHNAGTPNEFQSAYPSEGQIKHLIGFSGKIELDGDDTTIYVNRSRDSYPLAELHCVSHASLSPVKRKPIKLQ